jgi:hypothetical protein
MQGFIIFEDCGEFVAQMSAWFQEGTIKFHEDIVDGLAGCGKRPPAAFSYRSEAQRTAQRTISPLYSLRPCWTAFLRILHGCPASSQTSVSVTAIEVRMSFSEAC